MKFASSMVALLCLIAPTGAADLSRVERAIAKEPAYTSQPYYAQLVFGPDAAMRVWLVLDGEVLYLDRNGNGDLTDAGERVALDVEATKKTRIRGSGEYSGMNVFDLGEVAGWRLKFHFWVRKPDFVPKEEPEILREYRRDRKENGWENSTLWRITADGKQQAQNPILLCPRPQDAQVSHLDGPLTFRLKWNERQLLLRSSPETIFDVNIGTPGLPTRNYRHSMFSPLTTDEIPTAIHPIAHFEFANEVAGNPPIHLEVPLDQRCGGDTCYAAMKVPTGAAAGKAKVTLSFPAWKDRPVAPATFEVNVADTPPAK